MALVERLLDAIGAEAFDAAANEQPRFIDRIAERFSGIAEHNQVAGLPHEGGEMSDRSFDDDIDSLHRDATSRRCIAVDYEEAAAAGCASRLRCVAFHMDPPGHHVFGDTLAGVAVEDDVRLLVHAGAVIADMSLDLDRDRRVDAGSDRVLSARIEHTPMRFVGVRREGDAASH